MKCLTNFKNDFRVVEGDIIIFSETKAYLIAKSNVGYLAIQLLNNGNEELGCIDYYDTYAPELIERLCNDFGTPIKIVNMSEVSIRF